VGRADRQNRRPEGPFGGPAATGLLMALKGIFRQDAIMADVLDIEAGRRLAAKPTFAQASADCIDACRCRNRSCC